MTPIIKKTVDFICYKCDGKGVVQKENCTTCKGTGIWKETTYYFIDPKTKNCFQSDNLA